ncbi:cytochrome ubiquinol oxidase subunit I, partial [Enterobacter quasiroggenkampii]
TTLSAYFILAANSFMQHPFGVMFNEQTGRAELDPSQGSIFSVLSNPTTLAAFPHVITGAWLVAGAFVTGVAAWHMVGRHREAETLADGGEKGLHASLARDGHRPGVRFGVLVMVVAAVGVFSSGDAQAKLMF